MADHDRTDGTCSLSEAVRLLGLSRSTVRRMATDLGGNPSKDVHEPWALRMDLVVSERSARLATLGAVDAETHQHLVDQLSQQIRDLEAEVERLKAELLKSVQRQPDNPSVEIERLRRRVELLLLGRATDLEVIRTYEQPGSPDGLSPQAQP
jgi:TolA-binding protein